MPSISKIAAGAFTVSLPFTFAGTHETCADTSDEISCSGSSTNTCCIDSPGGLFQQVQFWDTNPSTGPSTSWTIHGLWPNNCDGTYSEDCDPSRDYTDITELLTNAGQTSVLDYMQTYWVSDDESNEAFWDHEWKIHGTCISTLNPSCYTTYSTGEEAVDFFTTAVDLFQTLPTYTWLANAGITPSSSQTYALSDLNSALESAFGAPVILLCQHTNIVYEIYYGFNTKGPLLDGNFIPVANTGSTTNCPGTIQYPPK